jgi:adenosylmethionine-8-amino-7-oxononanoate aminotransferase
MITTPNPFFYTAISMNEERHTAENIANGIENIINEIGISKVAAVITDNAANMKATWRILQRKYPQKIFLGCWAHAIHLWIKDILNLF